MSIVRAPEAPVFISGPSAGMYKFIVLGSTMLVVKTKKVMSKSTRSTIGVMSMPGVAFLLIGAKLRLERVVALTAFMLAISGGFVSEMQRVIFSIREVGRGKLEVRSAELEDRSWKLEARS